MQEIRITQEMIDGAKSVRGGWSKSQLAAVGISWPPAKGWKDRLLGRRIARGNLETFMGRPLNASEQLQKMSRPLVINGIERSVRKVPRAQWEAVCEREYGQRDATLLDLGFASYREYLDSKLWTSVKSQVKSTQGEECLCGNVATQVHHASYSARTLLGEAPENLFPVCGGCHKAAEFSRGGSKRPPAEATRILISIGKKRRKRAKKKLSKAVMLFESGEFGYLLLPPDQEEIFSSCIGEKLVGLRINGVDVAEGVELERLFHLLTA